MNAPWRFDADGTALVTSSLVTASLGFPGWRGRLDFLSLGPTSSGVNAPCSIRFGDEVVAMSLIRLDLATLARLRGILERRKSRTMGKWRMNSYCSGVLK